MFGISDHHENVMNAIGRNAPPEVIEYLLTVAAASRGRVQINYTFAT